MIAPLSPVHLVMILVIILLVVGPLSPASDFVIQAASDSVVIIDATGDPEQVASDQPTEVPRSRDWPGRRAVDRQVRLALGLPREVPGTEDGRIGWCFG